MEDINVQETLKKLKEEHVNNFVNSKLESDEFSDRQKGMITEWIKEAINLGYSLGEKYCIAEASPEVLKKVIGMFEKSLNNEEKEMTDENVRNILFRHRSILRWIVSALSSYDGLVDEILLNSPSLKPKVFECLGFNKCH